MGKIKVRKKAYLDGFYKFGIFVSFLLVTVLSVWLYSPVILSHADESAGAQVDVNVGSVISLVLDTNELNFHLKPKSSEAVSQEQTVTATVHTNHLYGYQLYFSSVDNDTDMTSTTSTDVIESLSSTNSALDVPSGSDGIWGYSKNGNDNSWNPIPTLSNPASVKRSFYPNGNNDSNTTLHLGIAAKSSLDAGTYSKNVEFSAVVGDIIDSSSFGNIVQMQQMTPSICANAEVGAAAILQDSRDGETYIIQKFDDNQCWMTQDLRLEGPITLTSAESDVVTDFALPSAMAAGGYSWTESYDAAVSKKLNNPVGMEGIGYNYYAASAGSVSGTPNHNSATASLCPKGWKLPSKTQWTTFLSANGITNDESGYNIITSAPFSFSRASSMYSFYNNSSSSAVTGEYWSSTDWSSSSTDGKYNATLRVSLSGSNYSVTDYLHDRDDAGFVRCVANLVDAVN